MAGVVAAVECVGANSASKGMIWGCHATKASVCPPNLVRDSALLARPWRLPIPGASR